MQYSRRFHNLRPVTKRSAINSRAAVLGWIFASALLLALCGTNSIAAQPAGSLFFDDFTRATDPGPLSPWVVAQGPWTVTGGVLQAANSGSYSDAYVPGNWSNITVQGSVRFPTSGWAAGLSARLNPATGTRYVANIFPENTPETGFGLHLRLMKFLDWTSYNTLVEVPLPGGNLGTNWHTVTMTLRANEIIVYLDGTQVTDFLDNSAPYTSGSIGAFQYNLGASFDNIGVWPAPPAATGEWYPAANGQTLSVAAPGVLANDSPANGTGLTATLLSTTSNGALTLNPNGSFSYTPSGGFTGRDSFTYEALDALTNSSPVTVLIQVSPPGSLFSDDFTRPTDPGQLLPWIIARGNWTITSGLMQGGVTSDYADAYVVGNWTNITIQSRIQFPATAEAAGLNARVNPATGARYVANIYPESSTVARLFVQVMKFSSWTDYQVLTAVPLPVSSVGTSWHTLSMTVQGNEISVQLDGSQVADVVDSTSPYTSGGVGVHQYQLGANFDDFIVWPVAPNARDDSYSIAGGGTLSIAAPGVLANDSPGTGTSLTATLLTTTSHGALTLNSNGSFTYTPAPNFSGSDSFTYQAVDTAAHSSPATVLIEVVPAGSLFFDDFTRATDPSPLSPWIAAQGSWTITSGVLQAGSSGSYSDAYIPGGWSNITVQATIRFPATAWAAGLSARLNPATGARYVANIFPETTPETGSALHLRLMKFSDWTSYNSLTEVPLPGGNLGTSWHTLAMTLRGNEIIVYLDGAQVADVLDGSSPYTSGGIGAFQYNLGASFDNLGVWPAPPATLPEWYPVANGQTLSVAAPGVLANDSPSTGTSLTATLVTTASHGALILNPNGSFSYTPSGGFTGRDTFTYEAVDALTNSSPVTVLLQVGPPGSLFADNFTRDTDPGQLFPWFIGRGNWTITGGLMQGDTSPDYADVCVPGNWANVTIQTRFQFPAIADAAGLNARVNPTTGARYVANIYPESSSVAHLYVFLLKFSSWTDYQVLGEIPLPGGSLGTSWHTLSMTVQGSEISVQLDGTKVADLVDSTSPYTSGGIGLHQYQLGANFDDVVVTPVAPTAAADTYSIGTGGTLTVAAPGVLGNDSPGNGSNLVATVLTTTSHGSLTLNADGSFSYAPAGNFIGTDSFTYKANDSFADSAAATVTIAVKPVITVTANNNQRVYGSGNPIFTGVLSGVQTGDNITASYTTTATSSSPVGTYTITPVLSDPDNKLVNYGGVSINNGVLSVTQAVLTVTGLSANNKIYNGTTGATISGSPGLIGIIGADQASLSGTASGTFTTRTVGVAKPVNVTGLTLGGASASNYSLTLPILSANISTAGLTISGLTAGNKVYDGTTAATLSGTPTLVGIFGTDQVSFSGTATATFATRTAGSAKTVNVAGLSLTGTDAGNYALTQPVLSANISTAGLTVSGLTASNKTYDGTTTATINGTPALVGIIGTDQVSLNGSATGTFATRTAGSAKPVNVTGQSLSGADAANYSLTEPTLSANISTASLTITGLTAGSKVYDNTTAATLGGTPSLVGVIGTDHVSPTGTAVGTFATPTAGSAKAVNVTGLSLSGTDAANYTLTEPVLSADITPANLTIGGLSAVNKIYDGTTGATLSGSPTLVGIIGTDQVSVSGTGIGTFTTRTVGSGKPVNVAGLSLSGANAANYSLTQPVLSANITPANLTINGLSAAAKIYDGTISAALNGTANLAGIIGTDQVSLSGSAVGTFVTRTVGSAKTVNVTGLTLSGADAANYGLTEPVLSANITPATLTITGVSANPKTYDNTTSATLSGSAVLVGILGTDQVSLSGIAVGTFVTRTAGPAKSVNLSGLSLAGADAANYSLSLPTLSANITPATLTVTGMAADNKVYDAGTAATIHTGVAVLVGVLGSDHVSLDATGALGTFDDANIGTAKTVAISGLVLAGTDAGNYSLIQPTLAANITPAGATASGITANDKIYDGTTAANLNTNGATLLGVLGTDQVTLVLTNSTGAFDSKTVGSAKTVTVSGLELVGPDAAKYTLAQPTTTATITAATLTVSGLSAQDKIYDSTQTASLAGTPQLVGIIGADQVSPDGTATGTFATRTAGSAKPVNVTGLTLIGDDAANYSLTQPVLSADITPASLTVTGLVADSKVYDDTTAATLAGTPVLVGVIGTDQVSLNSSDVAHLNAKVVGTFATRTAGAARTVTVSGLGLSGADAANYTLTEPVLSASIIPANLTITGLAVSSKVYDGTRAATLSGAPALVGVISPDQVTLSGAAIATFATQTAASAKPVNVTGLTLSGADAANYTLTQLVLSADIAPANLTINGLLASSKIYDGTTAAMLTGSPALAGIIGTDQVSLSGPASGTFASRTAESAKPVNLTGLSLTGADAGNYSLIVPVLSANIIPAAVTVTGITVDNKAYDGTTVATIHTGAALLVGALGTDTVSLDVTAALGAFDDSNVGTAKTVTVSGLALAGADASDYSLVQPILTANITAAGATVTGITAHDKVYDGTASATLNTNSAALAGVLSTDQVTLVLTNAAGTFDSKVVGSGKTVTVGGLALIGPDAAKYTLTQPITTAAITAANLTISGLSTQDRTYDGTSAATLGGTPELVGVIGTDQVSLSGTALGTFASRTVGSSKPVSVTGLTLTGSDAANYSLTEPVLSANISTANLTITGLTAGNKIYDGTTAGTLSGTPSLVGIIGADQVSLTGIATGTFANRNAGSAKPVSVTGLSLTGADAANYSLTEPALSANISTADLTVAGLTVDNKIYDGTIAATLSGTPALVGIIGADQVSLSGAAICTFANSTVASTKAVSVTGLSLSGTDAGNYSLTEPALSANITPANLTVTGITADNKTYDGSSTASIHVGAAALVGLLGSDNVTLNTAAALGTFADGNVGAAKMVAISGLALGGVDAGNYSLTQPTATANITPAGVTVVGITAHDKVYDGTASASLNTNGALLVGVLGIDQVTLTLTNATGAFDSKTVGNGKTVTVTGLQLVGPDAAKYTLTQPGTTAAITTATLTLSGLSAQNKVYDSTATATLTGTAKLVGIVGADQVNLNGTAVGAFATRTAGTAKSVNVTGLSLTGADSANYTLIEPVLSGDITSANLTITGLSASNKIYDGTTAATLSGTPTLAGIIGTDQVSLSGTAIGTFATRTAGSAKSVNVTGLTLSGADAANYNLTQPTLNANITQAALTVTGISADNKVYDGTTAATIHTGAAALAGVSGSDTVSLNRTAALGTFADAAAGTAKSVTVTGLLLTGADAGNYTLVQPTLTANITPALLTITADNQNRPYGLTNSPLTFTFTGFVNSETAAVLSGQPSLTTTATATSPAGTYAISASLGTLSAANYSFQFVNGTLTITPGAPLILGITRNTPSTVLISWTSVSNVTYRVQFASDLSSSTWTDLAPDITATGTTASAQDHPAGLTPKFYRILVVP